MSLAPRIADLPRTVLLLPLEPYLLLPRTSLPVTLTDDGSRRTLEAALAGEGLVGVVQARADGAGSYFPVGCLGRVVDLGESAEERRVVLEGVARFRLGAELPAERDGLARAEVSYEEFAGDLAEEDEEGLDFGPLKEQIVDFGRRALGTAGVLETLPPKQVVLFLAQTAPFAPAEKQALLEAPGLRELVERLARLLALNFLTTTPDAPSARVH